jgi:hypothetical protein
MIHWESTIPPNPNPFMIDGGVRSAKKIIVFRNTYVNPALLQTNLLLQICFFYTPYITSILQLRSRDEGSMDVGVWRIRL